MVLQCATHRLHVVSLPSPTSYVLVFRLGLPTGLKYPFSAFAAVQHSLLRDGCMHLFAMVQVKPDSGFWKGASYHFTFTIPALYPHDPPKVKHMSQYGEARYLVLVCVDSAASSLYQVSCISKLGMSDTDR